MPVIPEWIIILMALFAFVLCIIYAITRKSRIYAAWAWLAIPCFQSAWTYFDFLSQNIAFVDRAGLVRLSLASFLTTIIVIAGTLSYYNVKYR